MKGSFQICEQTQMSKFNIRLNMTLNNKNYDRLIGLRSEIHQLFGTVCDRDGEPIYYHGPHEISLAGRKTNLILY